jgi:hypothetical protein
MFWNGNYSKFYAVRNEIDESNLEYSSTEFDKSLALP